MVETLLQFLSFLPSGLLLAAVLLEAFILKRREKSLEPSVLWLLFCVVSVSALVIAVHFGLFLWQGNVGHLTPCYWAGGIGAAGTLAWVLKRQGRNRGLLLLRERFFDEAGGPPLPRPGQAFWILSWRGALTVTFLAGLGLALLGQPSANSTVAATGTPETAPADEAAATAPNGTEDPAAAEAATTDTPAPAFHGEESMDPTREALPSAEESAAAANAVAATDPPEGGDMGAPATDDTGTPAPAVPVVAVNARPVSRNSQYFSKIRPLFKKHCVSCHGAEKQKGDLRLDSPDAIRAGINGKPAIIPGDADKSRAYSVTGLPVGDDDRMPPKGAGLGRSEREALAAWITAGADLGDGVSIPSGGAGVFLVDTIAESLPAPDAALVEKLTAEHVIVRPLSKNGHVIELDFSHSDRAMSKLALDELAPIALNIYALDLSRTHVADDDLATVALMRNLSRLLLSRTAITDAGLAHLSGNVSLEQLNLYSTPITDAGLQHLTTLQSLKKIYLWQSNATDSGARLLAEKVPGIEINMGQ